MDKAADKPKCSKCNERDVFSKGLCSGCYGKQWRERRKAERLAAPKQLTEGEAIEGEIVTDDTATVPNTHLVALNPSEMQAARGDLKTWLEQKLTVIERDIVEANAAITEARHNGWATQALTSARNRAVDDETFYNKILIAVEAGHTIIPDFPISVFAVRRDKPDDRLSNTWTGHVSNTVHSHPAQTDCAPAGAGEYRNPQPEMFRHFQYARKDEKGKEFRPYTVERTGQPAGPITFPNVTARSPIMKATSDAMAEKTFDQIGVCFPIFATGSTRQVQTNSARAGDPLVIGQVVHKRVGSRQKVVSFIIAWHLNLNDL
jgi:hypothetical protein